MPGIPVTPYALVRAYPVGYEGYASDLGWAYYCAMCKDWSLFTCGTVLDQGQLAADVQGIELPREGRSSRFIAIPRPRRVPQDTRLVNWSVSGGTWEEYHPFRPPTNAGADDKWYLGQSDGLAAWSASTAFSLPANPNFAVALGLNDPPLSWLEATTPSYVAVTWGGEWTLLLLRSHPALLLRNGAQVAEFDLSWGDAGGTQGKWLSVEVMHLRGGIAIRKAEEDNWHYYCLPCTEGDISAAAAALTVSGRGCQCAIGLHQVAGTNASAYSPEYRLEKKRVAAPSYEAKVGDYRTPGASALAVAGSAGI